MKLNSWLSNFIDNLFEFKWTIYVVFIFTSMMVLTNIDRESLWYDEIWTANAALRTDSLSSMFSNYILNDVHPPLYYLILYYWGKIFGTNDFDVRLLSYLFILLSFIISFLLIKKYFTRKTAILFVLLSSFTPGVLYYAQELRMYALLYALANLASIIYFVFITKIKNNSKIDENLLISYFIIGVLICYTHFFGYLLIYALSSASILYSIKLKRNKNTKYLFITSFFIGVMGIFWLLIHFYFGGLGNKTQGHFWLSNNLKDTIKDFSFLLFVNKYGFVILIILLSPFFVPFSKLFNAIKSYLILFYPILILLITAYLISINTPILTYRNLIVILPLFVLLLSFIFNELYNEKKIYIVFYLIGLFTLGAYQNYTFKKQNWRDASKFIKTNFDCNTCIIPIKPQSADSGDGLMFVSYYLGADFTYSANGPKVQNHCSLIYIDGNTTELEIRNALDKNNISIPYKILNFNKVFVVIKK